MKTDSALDLWTIERQYAERGYTAICGVDEAGRGPLAGPVFAAAVILPFETQIEGLNDSKKLTDAKRRALFPVICEKAIAYGIGSASAQEIDAINILQATFLAMKRAVAQLKVKPGFLLVDGNRLTDFGISAESIVKGDSRSANIAAASILAKVTRDRLMMQYDAEYPQYGFAQHKGYGTAQHIAALRKYGPCPIHRRSFEPVRSMTGLA